MAVRVGMVPSSLLKTAQGHPMLVELKNGETYNGHLVSCDSYMNISLRKVICTSRDGDKFWRMTQCYIRGVTVKYLCIPDEVLDMVAEAPPPAPQEAEQQRPGGGRGRGRGRAGSGGGRGGGRGNMPGRGGGRGGRGKYQNK
eukprot:TRINITY_DN6016_c0_g1_i1.p2 TRINITY_DN6016_c0_g1~~TRINITY_DN6016_c0_g1_i1.p2  ORF type:complete len:149 (-),score=27.47 TRINITY_DN6016_c0_g1_i1:113-538(-)